MGKYDQEFIESAPGSKLAIRIYRKQENKSASTNPIVLVHGLLNSSDLFDLPESDHMGLSETLMNQGYDVFTYDQRGAGQSSCQDWDFGMYENALIDLPAVIQYAMRYTGSRKVILGGYSLGGLIIFLLVTYLTKTKSHIQNISHDNIHKVFTMASPGMIMERSGKWKHLFQRGENILNKMGSVINKTDFLKYQIYVRNPILSFFISRPTLNTTLKFAQRNTVFSKVTKALPVPNFLYKKTDMDSRTFMHVIRSNVLDKTSRKLFYDLISYTKDNGRIRLLLQDCEIVLPEDFAYWNHIPLLTFSSLGDLLVLSSEVEAAAEKIKHSTHFVVDEDFGINCGHSGFLFRDDLFKKIVAEISGFLKI